MVAVDRNFIVNTDKFPVNAILSDFHPVFIISVADCDVAPSDFEDINRNTDPSRSQIWAFHQSHRLSLICAVCVGIIADVEPFNRVNLLFAEHLLKSITSHFVCVSVCELSVSVSVSVFAAQLLY